MSICVPYIFHRVLDQIHRDVVAGLKAVNHPLLTELISASLLNTRTNQQLAALCALKGRTVSVYEKGKLLGKLRNCEIEYSTATICFTLIDKGRDGAIARSIEISPAMDIFVEY